MISKTLHVITFTFLTFFFSKSQKVTFNVFWLCCIRFLKQYPRNMLLPTCVSRPNLVILVKPYERNYGDTPEKFDPSRPAFQGHSRSLELTWIDRHSHTSFHSAYQHFKRYKTNSIQNLTAFVNRCMNCAKGD